ncbi:DNA-binding response regulator [Parapedobacter pyrenivorans]|uniref:DNA-binding response regulator n=1 Tax=Parapedobacter pyrenivorans TaxID=1305674 RepID=A0A917M6Y0_9SPHI|nr:response regulator transcription factor [Parapedobacter pyrenivorans]GGG81849.1 DNA-binding response regulator [Parapedobacter pyrenivorans]
MMTKVLLYDDHSGLRLSIQALLDAEDDMVLTGALPYALAVTEDINQYSPQIVLMDIDMPGISGIEAVRRIRATDETLPILMLTVFDDNDRIFDAVCAGASGYILKSSAPEELPQAIRSVLSGGAPMTGSVARKVLQMVPRARQIQHETYYLSDRETETLQLLVNGYSYKMIAAELNLSIDTIRFHIKKIYDKLHVHSATEAVSKTLKNNIL